MDIILDQIAIWTPAPNLPEGVINAKTHPAGTRYREAGSQVYHTGVGIIRYVKNYSKGKTEFALFVRTRDTAIERVEEQLDAVAKELKADYIKKAIKDATNVAFVYTNHKLEEK